MLIKYYLFGRSLPRSQWHRHKWCFHWETDTGRCSGMDHLAGKCQNLEKYAPPKRLTVITYRWIFPEDIIYNISNEPVTSDTWYVSCIRLIAIWKSFYNNYIIDTAKSFIAETKRNFIVTEAQCRVTYTCKILKNNYGNNKGVYRYTLHTVFFWIFKVEATHCLEVCWKFYIQCMYDS